jgi:hypothetical protein
VLIDGKGQEPDILVADKPIGESHFKIAPDFDYAWNSFDKYFELENVKHKRSLFYVRGEFWVVVDNLETDSPRNIETLWHWHPECEVYQKSGGVTATNNERGNLEIIPVGKSDWKVEFIKGQEKPEIQGWYSPEYNKFEPNVATVYSTQIVADATFVWLLIPSEKEAPKIETKVISKNESEIKLEVLNKNKGKWEIVIPYSDSRNAKLKFYKN